MADPSEVSLIYSYKLLCRIVCSQEKAIDTLYISFASLKWHIKPINGSITKPGINPYDIRPIFKVLNDASTKQSQHFPGRPHFMQDSFNESSGSLLAHLANFQVFFFFPFLIFFSKYLSHSKLSHCIPS